MSAEQHSFLSQFTKFTPWTKNTLHISIHAQLWQITTDIAQSTRWLKTTRPMQASFLITNVTKALLSYMCCIYIY